MSLIFDLSTFLTFALIASGSTPDGSEGRTASVSRARSEAKSRFREANRFYDLENFEDALEAYEQAYEAYPASAFLFNIGQCHRRLHQYEAAISYYERYLSEAADREDRALALDLLEKSKRALWAADLEKPTKRNLQPDVRSTTATSTAFAPTVASSSSEGPPINSMAGASLGAPAFVEPRDAVPASTGPAPSRARSSGPTPLHEEWWLWSLVGGGVAIIVGGVLLAASSGDDLPPASLGLYDYRDRTGMPNGR